VTPRRRQTAERDEWEQTMAALDEVLSSLTQEVQATYSELAKQEKEHPNDR
jgi:hypothetical protein